MNSNKNINVIAKKSTLDDNFYDVIYTMDKQTVKNRLLIIDNKISSIEKNIKYLNEQLLFLQQERSQIETVIGTTVLDIKTQNINKSTTGGLI